jgi:hypothetical protein
MPGLAHLLHLHRFFTEIVPFARLWTVAVEATGADDRRGRLPLALATPEQDIVVVYLPTGGEITLARFDGYHRAEWFNPRTGLLTATTGTIDGLYAPPEPPSGDRPHDWVLVLRRD